MKKTLFALFFCCLAMGTVNGEEGREGIVVATQPLAIPIGTVTAIMARDDRLKRWGVGFVPFPKGSDISQAVKAKKVMAAFAGDMPTLEMVATDTIKVSALVKMAFASVVARRVMTIEQLKGRRIANALNSSSQQVLLTALHNVGLSEKDVTLVNMDVGAMVGALADEEVDAFAAWEPTPAMALALHPDYFVVHRGLTFSFFYSVKTLIQDEPVVYREILASYIRAIRWMSESPANLESACRWNLANAAAFSNDPMPMFLSQCIDITSRDLLSPAPLGRIPPVLLTKNGAIAEKFRFLQDSGKIKEDIPLTRIFDAFDTQILEEILADEKKYGLVDYRYNVTTLPLP